jgi:uncharacterized membrane protein
VRIRTIRTSTLGGTTMNTRQRIERIYDTGERLAHDRHVRKSAKKAGKSVRSVSNDLQRHGLRHVAQSNRTARRLGVVSEAARDIARRSTKQQHHRRWPWLVAGGAALLAGGAAAMRLRGGTTMLDLTRRDKSIVTAVEVDVPVRTAYDQWTQFEEFPSFMHSIDRVDQIDATRLHWTATVAGVTREWTAEISEQIPEERVAWKSEDGGPDGVVTFHKLGDGRCRITALVGYEPDGLREHAGNLLRIDSHQVQQDLTRFKDLVELRAAATTA